MPDSNEYQIVEISEQPVPLCQLLKIANLVGGGGEAKIVISEGYVFLNGDVEYQKRKKVYENDIIEFNGDIIQVVINVNSKPKPVPKIPVEKPSKKTASNKSKKSKKPKIFQVEDEINSLPKSGRKPISF